MEKYKYNPKCREHQLKHVTQSYLNGKVTNVKPNRRDIIFYPQVTLNTTYLHVKCIEVIITIPATSKTAIIKHSHKWT